MAVFCCGPCIRLTACPSLSADIQEFYELTLLDESKTVSQKTTETIQVANKWDSAAAPIAPGSLIIEKVSHGSRAGSRVTSRIMGHDYGSRVTATSQNLFYFVQSVYEDMVITLGKPLKKKKQDATGWA